MKINWGFGPPKVDDAPSEAGQNPNGHVPLNSPDSEQHGWTAGASMATKAASGLLWAGLLAGPVALVLQLFETPVVQVVGGTSAVVQAGSEGADEDAGRIAAISEFAERAVAAWLATPAEEAESLAQFFGDIRDERPSVPWSAENAQVADIGKLDNGLWSVIVGVDATEGVVEQPEAASGSVPETAGPAMRRLYFQLPVLFADDGLIAQALPVPVAAPAGVDQIQDAYGEGLATDAPAIKRITNFLAALLVTGNRDQLDAFSTPGTNFPIINPPLYSAVEVTGARSTSGTDGMRQALENSGSVDVLVSVTLVGLNGQELPSQYALSLVAREGRWEVSAIRRSPVLAASVPLAGTPAASVDVMSPESG